ncbi:hypothetical protein SDC9_68948 [bioreactor metagenome]|uniref:Uncharacterized protein n=1 Tax=bioreactor metagenome TaxID=1076179 RepID=A0A644Y7D7_9ZZZZ
MPFHLRAELPDFLLDHRGERVRDTAMEHLVAGCDYSDVFDHIGQNLQQRFRPCQPGGLFHLGFLDDQRDDAGAAQFVPCPDLGVAMPDGDHHFAQTVDQANPLFIRLQKTVHLREGVYFAFLNRRGADMLGSEHVPQNFRRFVLMEDAGTLFPDIQGILAQRQQNGDILLRHNVPLAEAGVLRLPADDLGNIMAEHMPHRVFGRNEFQSLTPCFLELYSGENNMSIKTGKDFFQLRSVSAKRGGTKTG